MYAIIVTAVLFFVLGVIAVTSYEAHQTQRELNLRKQKKSIKSQATQTDANDAAMDEAVALVQDKLGGKILT